MRNWNYVLKLLNRSWRMQRNYFKWLTYYLWQQLREIIKIS